VAITDETGSQVSNLGPDQVGARVKALRAWPSFWTWFLLNVAKNCRESVIFIILMPQSGSQVSGSGRVMGYWCPGSDRVSSQCHWPCSISGGNW